MQPAPCDRPIDCCRDSGTLGADLLWSTATPRNGRHAVASLPWLFEDRVGRVQADCGWAIQTRTVRVAAVSTAKNDDSREIDEMIQELGDWRRTMLSQLRSLIKEAVPGVEEELKWRKPSNPHGVPTWSYNGPICTGETYKKVVKLTFFKGASLADPAGLFNSSLQGNTRRAIDFAESGEVDESALKALVRAAVDLNSE